MTILIDMVRGSGGLSRSSNYMWKGRALKCAVVAIVEIELMLPDTADPLLGERKVYSRACSVFQSDAGVISCRKQVEG